MDGWRRLAGTGWRGEGGGGGVDVDVCLGKRGLLVGDAVVGSEDAGIFRFAESQVPEDLMPFGAGRIQFKNCCTDLQNVYTKWMPCEHSRYSTLSNARAPHRTLVAPLAHTCNIFMTP